MVQATIFTNNKSQAIRIPKALAFPDGIKKVSIIPAGNGRLITPVETAWDNWFAGDAVTTDFMAERGQPTDQEREAF